jgi:hypothetical protein
VPAGEGAARIIGLDDLYLDRVRQATVDERENRVEFASALAVAAAAYDRIDWQYVTEALRASLATDPYLGVRMRGVDARVRRRVRRTLR